MSEFFKEEQRKYKAEKEWLSNYRSSLERARQNIEKHQERRLLTIQVILLVFVGAFLINLLTSSIFDLVSSVNQLTFQRRNFDFFAISALTGALAVVFFLVNHQLSTYEPSPAIVRLLVTPEDTRDFLDDKEFQQIERYLMDGRLKNFKVFGDAFFNSLSGWLSHLFNDKVPKEPVEEKEELELPIYRELPTMMKKYDISAMSTTGVKVMFAVFLAPEIVYSFSEDQDKTASYSFKLVFFIKILNPDHCDAEKFLDEYFDSYAYRLLSISSYCIAAAFRKTGGTSATQTQS